MPNARLDSCRTTEFAKIADRLRSGGELVELVLAAEDVPLGPFAGKLRAVATELIAAGTDARTLHLGGVDAFVARLDLARRALLVSIRFRCSPSPAALEDLGVVADELRTVCDELLLLRAVPPRAAGGAR